MATQTIVRGADPESRGEWSREDLRGVDQSVPSEDWRESLLDQYRPLAMAVLQRLGCRQDEDLRQVALLGLVKALDRFDPHRGASFSSYAWPTIAGEVKRYLRDHARLIRPPRSLLDQRAAVLTKVTELTARKGCSPTISEIADALEADPDEVVEALAMDEICRPSSLDGLLPTQEGDRSRLMAEFVGNEDVELERVETRSILGDAIATLEPKLRAVIAHRYRDCLSQRETGRQLGVSQMQVSRLERRALNELRAQLAIAPEELLAA
jgi:RNA polymerase sigma-B factor